MTDNEPQTLAEWAVWYAEQGLRVLPLVPRSKVPASDNGVYDATSDVSEIARIWSKYPECNVGLAMGGGWVAIDIDVGHASGIDGWDSVNEWESEHGELRDTWRSITGSGGQHMVYRVDNDFANGVGSDGVDVKGAGGYIVAPPSVNAEGGLYMWECGFSPLDMKAAAADENVKGYIHTIYPKNTPHTASERATAASSGKSAHGEHGFQLPTVIMAGSRDETLYKYACQLQQFGWTDDAIMDEVERVNAERCEPPMLMSSVRKTVKSALRHPKGDNDEDLQAYIDAARMMTSRPRKTEFSQGAADVIGMPPIISLADIANEPIPQLRPEIIEGVLRENCKMLVQGASKAGKTWLMIELAVAMATGGEWLGWRCRQGRVLYINLELQHETFMNRLDEVCSSIGVPFADACANIDLWNLRGHSASMADMNRYAFMPSIAPRKYQLIIFDPFYKLMTGSENDAEVVGEFVRELERLCVECDTAVVYVHHYSKGAKGDVSPMDRSSGSGVFARDADALIDLAELDAGNLLMPDGFEDAVPFRVTPIMRDFKWQPPFDVFFTADMLHVRDEYGALSDLKVDSASVRGGRVRGEQQAAVASERADMAVEAIVEMLSSFGGAMPAKDIRERLGVTHKTLMKYVDGSKKLTHWNERSNNSVMVSLEPKFAL